MTLGISFAIPRERQKHEEVKCMEIPPEEMEHCLQIL
ncbi:MAG: hypothetical protein JWL77_2810, partial [Chthonomonadaceae bacterium]|nr:hypothetical protein [Chthonomonadaceae bacterium]